MLLHEYRVFHVGFFVELVGLRPLSFKTLAGAAGLDAGMAVDRASGLAAAGFGRTKSVGLRLEPRRSLWFQIATVRYTNV